MLGSNISRFGAIARQGCHTDQWERAGAFYMLMGESRLGKGIAMNLLWKLEITIQQKRSLGFPTDQNTFVERPHSFCLGETEFRFNRRLLKMRAAESFSFPNLKLGRPSIMIVKESIVLFWPSMKIKYQARLSGPLKLSLISIMVVYS